LKKKENNEKEIERFKGSWKMDIIKSKDGVPIRLTAERWFHIIENHEIEKGKFLAAVYKEINKEDGFIISYL
jgi:hypothetical protein